jgi:hypothetical protein
MKKEKQINTDASSKEHDINEITSESIDNAHASGDGTVMKSDEILPDDNENTPSLENEPY